MALTKENADKHRDILDTVGGLFTAAYLLYSIGTGLMEDGEEMLDRNGMSLDHEMKYRYKCLQADFDRFSDSIRRLMSIKNKKDFMEDFDNLSADIAHLALSAYRKEHNTNDGT